MARSHPRRSCALGHSRFSHDLRRRRPRELLLRPLRVAGLVGIDPRDYVFGQEAGPAGRLGHYPTVWRRPGDIGCRILRSAQK